MKSGSVQYDRIRDGSTTPNSKVDLDSAIVLKMMSNTISIALMIMYGLVSKSTRFNRQLLVKVLKKL